jgi:hypothetical protein
MVDDLVIVLKTLRAVLRGDGAYHAGPRSRVALSVDTQMKQCGMEGTASTVGSTNMRLVARMIAAIVVTVLAALVLYFVFLHNQRPAHGEVQRMDHHIRYSPASEAEGLRYLTRVGE